MEPTDFTVTETAPPRDWYATVAAALRSELERQLPGGVSGSGERVRIEGEIDLRRLAHIALHTLRTTLA